MKQNKNLYKRGQEYEKSFMVVVLLAGQFGVSWMRAMMQNRKNSDNGGGGRSSLIN